MTTKLVVSDKPLPEDPDWVIHGSKESGRFVRAYGLAMDGILRIELNKLIGPMWHGTLIADLDIEGARKLQKTIAKFLAEGVDPTGLGLQLGPCGLIAHNGQVFIEDTQACEAGRHRFSSDSTSATIIIAPDHRCLCGAMTYGEAGQFEER